MSDEFVDGSHWFGHAGDDASAQPRVGQIAEVAGSSAIRCSVWTGLFSSQQSTGARSGGGMHRPAMSLSFSTGFGSRETASPRTMCGVRPSACQCRITVPVLPPSACGASERRNSIGFNQDWKHCNGYESIHTAVVTCHRVRLIVVSTG